MDVFNRLKSEDPDYENRLRDIEYQIQEYIKNNGQDHLVVTIPVVVHVVYKTSAQNISDAQVQTQLNVLNEDLRKLNSDRNLVPAPFQPLHADCEINFCMAVRDRTEIPQTVLPELIQQKNLLDPTTTLNSQAGAAKMPGQETVTLMSGCATLAAVILDTLSSPEEMLQQTAS